MRQKIEKNVKNETYVSEEEDNMKISSLSKFNRKRR
jgi:hypothetical protein